jgi:hypothetical protein
MMEELEQPRKGGTSVVRLLAAALAGAIGAFGMPAAAHRAEPIPQSSAAPSASLSADSTTD